MQEFLLLQLMFWFENFLLGPSKGFFGSLYSMFPLLCIITPFFCYYKEVKSQLWASIQGTRNPVGFNTRNSITEYNNMEWTLAVLN